MHPYSEFLQEFVYNYSGLVKGDKFDNDFRVTTWGSFLRRYWIDEIPMLLNLIKGDIKLIGVRPLSQQKLNLYNEDYRKRRYNYKPGLIPPYYVDLPESLDETVQSEVNYLNKYDKNKFGTDIKYFFKAFNNIVINKRRSA